MTKTRLTKEAIFKAAQNPANWLLSAERLCHAAEIILKQEEAQEVPYFRAHDAAMLEALAIAYTGTNEAGSTEIPCLPPNYPPAQLLYAYAIENVLKGLIVASDSTIASENKISDRLKSHDLIKLSREAGVDVQNQDRDVLNALSNLSVWAGRYPVALTKDEYVGNQNPHTLLDYGSQNVVMRQFFVRILKQLEAKLPRSPSRFDVAVVFRQPGT